MTQDKREQNDKNSAFEFKLRTASDQGDRNISDELDILKPKILQEINQTGQKKKRPDTNSLYNFIARTNINKELAELVVEGLITQNIIFNKKTVEGLDSFE